MSEFQPVSSLEVKYTMATLVKEPTEPSIQQKILAVSTKATEAGIFDDFETQQKRNDGLDEIVRLASGEAEISSYEELINRSCDPGRDQTKVQETFDILRRGFSLAINNDEKLQTSLNVGGIKDILPEAAKYNNMGNSKLDLEKGILEVTITNPKIREIYSEISEIREDYDLSVPKERKKAAEKIEPFYDQLLDLSGEAKTEGFKEEWMQAKAYLGTEIGTLYGELNSSSGSVNRTDEVAILGSKLVEVTKGISEAADKMSEAADKMSDLFETGGERKIKRGERMIDEDDTGEDEKTRFNKAMSRAGTEMKHRFLPETEEGRREWVEERLNMIERYKTRSIKNELALSDWMYPLQEFMSVTEDSNDREILAMRKMINTRLTLKAMGDALGKVSGSLDERQGMFSTMLELADNGFVITPDVMEAFYNNELYGFRTAEAWDLMELANFDYGQILVEAFNGASDKLREDILKEFGSKENFFKVKPLDYSKNTPLEGKCYNYFFEANGNRVKASLVRRYMIEKLQGLGIDEYHAEKSLRMAEFMYDATGETSVVNWDFVNGDEYAELINTAYLRWLDSMGGKKGKKSGPPLTILKIKHMSAGWLRSMCSMKDPTKMVTSKDIVDKALTYKADKTRGLEGKKLYLAYFISITKQKLLPAKLLVCSEETPDASKILNDAYFKSVNDAFNKVDGDVAEKEMYGSIKTMWLAGIIQQALIATDSKWTKNDFLKLKGIVTTHLIKGMSEQAENEKVVKTFVTKKQWKWIEDHLNVTGVARADGMVATFGDFLDRLGGQK